MLHRLFSTKGAPGVNPEDDHRTHHLLYGAQACFARGTCRAQNEARVQDAFAESHVNTSDVRVIVAQDLGDKAKVVLLDSKRPKVNAQTQTDHRPEGDSSASNVGATPRQSRRKDADATPTAADTAKRGGQSLSADVLAELMFGTAPLSFRGTSVRVHPLPNADAATAAGGQESRQFLFTKAFNVDILVPDGGGAETPATATSSGCNSLSSSYSNVSALQEYPFPRLTPISSTAPSPAPKESSTMSSSRRSATSPRAAAHLPQHSIHHHAGNLFGAHSHTSSLSNSHGSQSRHAQFGAGLPDAAVLTPFEGPVRHVGASLRSLSMTPLAHQRKTSRHHARVPSHEDRSVPHVPFVPAEVTEHSDYFSGWLPSPEPKLHGRSQHHHRRSSIDTTRSSPSAGGGGGGHGSRFQSTTIAIGVVFTVPGSGMESHECAVMTRYWQMVSRAAFALQRAVHDEVEPALTFVATQGVLPTPRSIKSRPVKGEAQVYQRGKKYYIALAHHALAGNRVLAQAVHDFQERLIGAITLPAIRHMPLQTEAELLVDEIQHLMSVLDRKERNFMLSTTLSYLSRHRELLQSCSDDPRSRNSLGSRIVIVSDDAVLARRFLYCLARLFFRRHNEHIRNATDYAMVWPSTGILGQDRRDLIKRRGSSLQTSKRNMSGWDIPSNAAAAGASGGAASELGQRRPGRSDSHEQFPSTSIHSPSSIYLRPPSSGSTSSSRASSWKPSWSWFGAPNGPSSRYDDGLRSRRSLDGYGGGGGSIQSETRTLQTSWTSSEFNDVLSAGITSPRSPQSPPSKARIGAGIDDDAASEVYDDDEVVTPPDELKVAKREDGRVNVELLATAPLLAMTASSAASSIVASNRARRTSSNKSSPHRPATNLSRDGGLAGQSATPPPPLAMLDHAPAFHEFPLTGYLTRFHPDMLLQGVPATGFDEDRVRQYLREEELHVHRSTMTRSGPGEDESEIGERTVSILLIELGCRTSHTSATTGGKSLSPGHGWRLRKISRKPSRPSSPTVQVANELARAAAAALYGETSDVPSPGTGYVRGQPSTASNAASSSDVAPISSIAAPIPTRAVAFADLAQPPSILSTNGGEAGSSKAGSTSSSLAGDMISFLAPPPRLPLQAILQANSPSHARYNSNDEDGNDMQQRTGTPGDGSDDAASDRSLWDEEIVGGIDEALLKRVQGCLAGYRRDQEIAHVRRLVELFQ